MIQRSITHNQIKEGTDSNYKILIKDQSGFQTSKFP